MEIIKITGENEYPDGMIESPDGKSCIIAIYTFADVEHGKAYQFSLETGALEAEWSFETASKITCPILVEKDGKTKVIFTSAR